MEEINESGVKTPEEMAFPEQMEIQRGAGRRSYRREDLILGVVLLLGAWFYVRGGAMFGEIRLAVFTVYFLAAGGFYLAVRREKMPGGGRLYFAFTLFAGLWFCLRLIPAFRFNGEQEIEPYVGLFLHVVGVYWLLTIARCRMDGCLNENGVRDLGRGFFILPAVNFCRLPEMVFRFLEGAVMRKREEGEKKREKALAVNIFWGVFGSIPVLLIVLPVLAKADESFELFLGNLADWCGGILNVIMGCFSLDEILVNLLIFLIGCYLFGLFYGAFHTKPPKTGKKIEMPAAMLATFSAVICGVYLLFFIVKFSDAAGILFGKNRDVVYSSFARQGFFELCFIAVINFCLFYGVKAFAGGEKRIVKILLSLLGTETLGFIALAFSKMSLYISVYGFTFKRVFTSWFMGVLFFTFVLLIRAIWKKNNAIRPAVIFASVTFLLLAYSNVELWMAGMNAMMQAAGAVI